MLFLLLNLLQFFLYPLMVSFLLIFWVFNTRLFITFNFKFFLLLLFFFLRRLICLMFYFIFWRSFNVHFLKLLFEILQFRLFKRFLLCLNLFNLINFVQRLIRNYIFSFAIFDVSVDTASSNLLSTFFRTLNFLFTYNFSDKYTGFNSFLFSTNRTLIVFHSRFTSSTD